MNKWMKKIWTEKKSPISATDSPFFEEKRSPISVRIHPFFLKRKKKSH
jgi:hypothetical protein